MTSSACRAVLRTTCVLDVELWFGVRREAARLPGGRILDGIVRLVPRDLVEVISDSAAPIAGRISLFRRRRLLGLAWN